MSQRADEASPLLDHHREEGQGESEVNEWNLVKFHEDDEENPQAWTRQRKLTNIGIISGMALLSPLASSMFTPGIAQVADDLGVDQESVIATTTGFVIMLGFGPLVLAPLSETFGRRKLYIWCFVVFTFLQIPTALSPNVGMLIAARTISGFFGSMSAASGFISQTP